MMGYSANLLKYFRCDEHVGVLDAHANDVVCAHVGRHGVTDVVQLSLKVDENRLIVDAKYKVFGNPYTMAITAWLCAQLIDQSIDALTRFSVDKFVEHFDIPSTRIKSAILVEDLLRQCYQQFRVDE